MCSRKTVSVPWGPRDTTEHHQVVGTRSKHALKYMHFAFRSRERFDVAALCRDPSVRWLMAHEGHDGVVRGSFGTFRYTTLPSARTLLQTFAPQGQIFRAVKGHLITYQYAMLPGDHARGPWMYRDEGFSMRWLPPPTNPLLHDVHPMDHFTLVDEDSSTASSSTCSSTPVSDRSIELQPMDLARHSILATPELTAPSPIRPIEQCPLTTQGAQDVSATHVPDVSGVPARSVVPDELDVAMQGSSGDYAPPSRKRRRVTEAPAVGCALPPLVTLS